MQTLMSVDPEWLPRLAESYCDFIEIKDEEPRYLHFTQYLFAVLDMMNPTMKL